MVRARKMTGSTGQAGGRDWKGGREGRGVAGESPGRD